MLISSHYSFFLSAQMISRMLLSWWLCVERIAPGQNWLDSFMNMCVCVSVWTWEALELGKGHNVSLVTQSLL